MAPSPYQAPLPFSCFFYFDLGCYCCSGGDDMHLKFDLLSASVPSSHQRHLRLFNRQFDDSVSQSVGQLVSRDKGSTHHHTSRKQNQSEEQTIEEKKEKNMAQNAQSTQQTTSNQSVAAAAAAQLHKNLNVSAQKSEDRKNVSGVSVTIITAMSLQTRLPSSLTLTLSSSSSFFFGGLTRWHRHTNTSTGWTRRKTRRRRSRLLID